MECTLSECSQRVHAHVLMLILHEAYVGCLMTHLHISHVIWRAGVLVRWRSVYMCAGAWRVLQVWAKDGPQVTGLYGRARA